MATFGPQREKFEAARRRIAAKKPRRKRRNWCVGAERAAARTAIAVRRLKPPLIVTNISMRSVSATAGSHRLCFLYGHMKPKSF